MSNLRNGPLTHPLPNYEEITTPFAGDIFQRQQLARKLTNYLSRMKAGAVIGIDAPWGEGKSFFGRHWAALLRVEGYRVAYIDAFEQDYIEDPFLLIATELAELFQDDPLLVQDIKERTVGVMRAILPTAIKGLINIGGLYLLGQSDLADKVEDSSELVLGDSADAVANWVSQRFDSHTTERLAIKSFKERLQEIALSADEPLVIFIDELDRCRPDFAVSLIERLKHFFCVPNVVFVLLLNREQLQVAIKGVYGDSTNAANYLGKFINFFFSLPKGGDNNEYDHARYYIKSELDKYGADYSNAMVDFAPLACFCKLSLRDIEKAVALFIFSGLFEVNRIDLPFLLYAICLKLSDPDLYTRILKNDLASHEELARRLNIASLSGNKYSQHYRKFSQFHTYRKAKLTGDNIDYSRFSERFRELGDMGCVDGFLYLDNVLNDVNKMIDLTVR